MKYWKLALGDFKYFKQWILFFSIKQQQLPLQYAYQRPDILGNYSESEHTQFSSHTTRPVIEPKVEKINTTLYSSEMKSNPHSVKLSSLGTDGGYVQPKLRQSSSLVPLKVLPKGIGYAEAINAGKSR